MDKFFCLAEINAAARCEDNHGVDLRTARVPKIPYEVFDRSAGIVSAPAFDDEILPHHVPQKVLSTRWSGSGGSA